MRWAGHIVRIGEMANAYKILVGKLERKIQCEDVGVGLKIILECILGK
jgi:hypothetical protein